MSYTTSPGGASGEHSAADPFELFVAPTTTGHFNVIRLPLIPIASFRVDDIRFAFDSSFISADLAAKPGEELSDIRAELVHLAALVKAHPGAPLSIFGHADPVGSDDYNKLLSGRRAMALYALLLVNADPDLAVGLWQRISNTERWGADQWRTMRAFTGLPEGAPDDIVLRSYGQKLCPPELTLLKEDFLGGGADSDGKAAFHGCGEFNPLLVFSKERQRAFERARTKNDQEGIALRNAENALNRRVLMRLFRKGSHVDPAKWPCPRATEGVAGCKERFFSDGQDSRGAREATDDRSFAATRDTFACRFYQRLSETSPCQAGGDTLKLGPDGQIDQEIPVEAELCQLTVVGEEIRLLVGHLTSLDSPACWRARLNNLGYQIGRPEVRNDGDGDDPDGGPELRSAVEEFQCDNGLDVTGICEAATRETLLDVHGC